MGAPVSKTDDSSTSEVLSGSFSESSIGENCSPDSVVPVGEDGNCVDHKLDLSETVYEEDTVDTDNTVCGDIHYKRLKTNGNDDDLQIQNSCRNRNDKLFPRVDVTTTGPIFTSAVTERPTRITSANFSPHSVLHEQGKPRIKTARRRTVKVMEGGGQENTKTDQIHENVIDPKNEESKQNLCDLKTTTCIRNNDITSNSENSNSKADNVKNERFNQRLGVSSIPMFQGQSTLNVPGATRGIQSPIPRSHSTDNLSDDDEGIDPLEGLSIPSEKLRSADAMSIYSMKEISDDLYQEYMTEIKKCMRSHGFFEAFPSPSVVSEAQKIYRNLEMPSPVDEDGNVLPHPSKLTKKDFFSIKSIQFEDIVQRITNVPESIITGKETVDIVNHLCKDLEDDRDKLVVLAAWVVHQQLQQQGQDTAGRSNTHEDWCKNLKMMCKFARIKTKLISGMKRGHNYVAGSDADLSRGQWLAVLVNYTWLLLDPSINKHQIPGNVGLKLLKDVNSIHLVPAIVQEIFHDPEEFIFNHYPDEEHWQLLARPVTKEEYPELAVLKSGFFNFKMAIINCPKSTVKVKSPEALISLSFHQDQILQFKCLLKTCDNSLTSEYLRTCVFLETNFKDYRVNIRVRFPIKCAFSLELLGSPDDYRWESVISYNIQYEGDAIFSPFPTNQRDEWGPGLECVNLGLTPLLYHSGEIIMHKGVIQVAFHDKKNTLFNYVLLQNDVKVSSEASKVSFLRDKNKDVIFVIDIDPKITGTFILQILAKTDKRSDFKNICNYFIRKEKMKLVPKLEFTDRSSTTEEKKPIYAPDDGKFQLTVDTTGFIQLAVELKLQGKQDLSLPDHARHWICEDNTGYVDLNFPRKGRYSVRVLGRTATEGSFQIVREETVIVRIPSMKWSCFPKHESSWNSWYKMETPLTHHLKEKEDIMFQLDVKHALDVAVLAANGWYHLNRVYSSWQWTGQVWTGPKSTKCRLLARFDEGSDKWSDLLWFKVMSGVDYCAMEKRQKDSIEHAVEENEGVNS